MKNPSFSKKSCALALAMSAIVAPVMAQNYLNFTNDEIDGIDQTIINYQSFDYHAAVVGDALFRRAESFDPSNSGAGQFRALYRLNEKGIEQGYNRRNVSDATTIGGSTGELVVSEMVKDNTGNFYIFAIDTNNGGDYISLDKFQVWSGTTAPASLPEVTTDPDAELATLGTQIYNMDNLSDTTIFLDSNLSTGNGTLDMFIFVSVALFDDAGVNATDQVYIYTQFGAYDDGGGPLIDMGASAGNEEIAVLADTSSIITVVPEPSSAILVAFGGAMLAFRRRRA
jgi:hypothetical protein